MTADSTNTPDSAKPLADADWLASLSHEALTKEAIRRNQVIAEIVAACQMRAEGKYAAADFDKEIAEILEGDGWFSSSVLLERFRKGDVA